MSNSRDRASATFRTGRAPATCAAVVMTVAWFAAPGVAQESNPGVESILRQYQAPQPGEQGGTAGTRPTTTATSGARPGRDGGDGGLPGPGPGGRGGMGGMGPDDGGPGGPPGGGGMPSEAEWQATSELMQKHTPNWWARFQRSQETQWGRRMMRSLVERHRELQRIERRDPEQYKREIEQLALEDEILGVARQIWAQRAQAAAEPEGLKSQLRERVGRLVDLRIRNREARLQRLAATVEAERKKLEADRQDRAADVERGYEAVLNRRMEPQGPGIVPGGRNAMGGPPSRFGPPPPPPPGMRGPREDGPGGPGERRRGPRPGPDGPGDEGPGGRRDGGVPPHVTPPPPPPPPSEFE